jgi:hypothetical protein
LGEKAPFVALDFIEAPKPGLFDFERLTRLISGTIEKNGKSAPAFFGSWLTLGPT